MENEESKTTNESEKSLNSDPFPPNGLKNVIAQTYSQKRAEEELLLFARKKVAETWEQLIYWLSVYLEEVRKRGGTMGHKVGSIRNQVSGLKGLFDRL